MTTLTRGTTTQEVIRAAMHRTRYVQDQSRITSAAFPENYRVLYHAGQILVELEDRSARVHGRIPTITVEEAEYGPSARNAAM